MLAIRKMARYERRNRCTDYDLSDACPLTLALLKAVALRSVKASMARHSLGTSAVRKAVVCRWSEKAERGVEVKLENDLCPCG